jgi:hypothetical protein
LNFVAFVSFGSIPAARDVDQQRRHAAAVWSRVTEFNTMRTSLAALIAPLLLSVSAWGTEPAVELIGLDGMSLTLSAAAFAELPHIDIEAKNHDGDMVKYSGVKLRTLLAKVGIPEAGQPLRAEWVRRYVVIEAADGYSAVYALAELDETLTDRELLLADRCNGTPLDAHDGPFQVINPREKRHSRWVRMVQRIQIVDSRAATP